MQFNTFFVQDEIPEEELEPFGDVDDATLTRLGNLKERTKYEEERYQKLRKLQYLRTRTLRSQARRVNTVSDVAAKVESFMNEQKLDAKTTDNKLPDFKLQQIQGYFTNVPGKQLSSPYCLVTNPDQKEEDFIKKFKEGNSSQQ